MLFDFPLVAKQGRGYLHGSCKMMTFSADPNPTPNIPSLDPNSNPYQTLLKP